MLRSAIGGDPDESRAGKEARTPYLPRTKRGSTMLSYPGVRPCYPRSPKPATALANSSRVPSVRAKRDDREAARILRAAGQSVTSIAADLDVSKASVSDWVADIALTRDQRQALSRRPGRREASPPNPPVQIIASLHPQFDPPETPVRPRHRTKGKGDVAEAMAQAAFIVHGFVVSRPFSENAPYDYILDDGARLARVQVKHGRYDRSAGHIRFAAERASRYTKGPYTADECDFFVVWCSDLGKLYAIPHAVASTRRKPHLRVNDARNRQSAGILLADDFTFDGSLPWPA